MKKTLSTILLGASLIFGNLNKAKAQECECVKYNHDADEFPEEIVCWKKEGFNYSDLKPNQNKAKINVIYYADRNNDNFHEEIRTFNYAQTYGYNLRGYLNIEFFNVQKETGTINYSWKQFFVRDWQWKHNFAQESPYGLMTKEIPRPIFKNYAFGNDHYNLTSEQICSIYPNSYMSYGGFCERTKKLISAGKDLEEIKKMVESERAHWK